MIIDLHIPEVRDELSLHRVGSWEEEEANHDERSLNSSLPKSREPSLTSHALASGSFVFGVKQMNRNRNDEPWTTWKTSFAPYRVCRVASNRDGSIIACSTDVGTVALLRGEDGSVLATRKVVLEEESVLTAPYIAFIGNSPRNNCIDALIIWVPNPDPSRPELDFMLVSDIYSLALNDKNSLKIAEAARNMSVKSSLRLSHGASDVRAVCGFYLDEKNIRFVTIDERENIALLDYNYKQADKQPVDIQQSFLWKREDSRGTSINFDPGLHLHELRNGLCFVLFCAHEENATWIHCFDPIKVANVGEFTVPAELDNQRIKVLAFEPLITTSPETVLALAVASQSNENAAIHVLQAELCASQLKTPHVVYTIPIHDLVESISLSSLSQLENGAYAFRYKVWQGSDNSFVKAFVTAESGNRDGSLIGKARLLIQAGHFDAADELVNSGHEITLVKDRYANFHPSEVALGRLQMILEEGKINQKESLAQAKLCLHRLASGCISGNEKARINLLEAAESIAGWATPGSSLYPPSLGEVTAALSTIVKTIEEVSNILPIEKQPVFHMKRQMLRYQLVALEYLSDVIQKDGGAKIAGASSRLQSSRNAGELFANLIAEGHFAIAEGMWKSSLRPQISPEVAVGSILKIDCETDPKTYLCLLEEAVMPCLSINHELLPSLWMWACRMANEMDDRGSISDAILLLESVRRGTSELQLRIHSSFAFFSPFVDSKPASEGKSKSRKDLFIGGNGPDLSLEFPTDKDRLTALFENSIPIPTLLEVSGCIKGGAMKKSRPMTNRAEKFNYCIPGPDTEEGSEGPLHEKLLHAKCLDAARRLGLEMQVATLRSFTDFGTMQNFAKELVRQLSLSVETHQERCAIFIEKVKPFCDRFEIDFDATLLQYSKELCGSTIASPGTIHEAASVAQCAISVSQKCHCILTVLRAALFCGYSPLWLKSLAQEAVKLASLDISLRSELVEAARLLLIDGIVRKYVGDSSLFRVDNPRHAVRLLDFITEHFCCDSVLEDALDLVDAFSHLSRLEACTNLCCQAILDGRVDICIEFCEKVYEKDPPLGDNTCIRVVAYCTQLVNECARAITVSRFSGQFEDLKKTALNASQAACSIIPLALAHMPSRATELFITNLDPEIDVNALEVQKLDFSVIYYLQREFSVFGLSISDIRCGPKMLLDATKLVVGPVLKAYNSVDDASWKVKLTKARRACSLLASSCNCSEAEFWSAAVALQVTSSDWVHEDCRGLYFLRDLEVLGGFRSTAAISARTLLAVAFSLCVEASSGATDAQDTTYENFSQAISLLQDYCMTTCPENLLLYAQTLSGIAESVWHVLLKADEGIGDRLEASRKKFLEKCWELRSPFTPSTSIADSLSCPRPYQLHPSWYVGDGLLLPPSETLGRSRTSLKVLLGFLTVRNDKLCLEDFSEMMNFLCSRGALSVALHFLANFSMVLFSSKACGNEYWPLRTFTQKIVAEGASRYVGGTGNGITNKIVDSQQAVSFLLSLPIKTAFKVYRAALPSAMKTRDFTRVLALANIGVVTGTGSPGTSSGRNLNVAWKKQDRFASQCKQLGTKAFWWGFLRKYKIDFDARRLDVADNNPNEDKAANSHDNAYVLSLVTLLLARLLHEADVSIQGALRIATMFAKSFEISHEKVLECCVRFLLSSPHTDSNDKDDIRNHLSRVEVSIRAVLPLLQPVVRRATILRQAVLALEKDKACAKDYARHSIVLNLYRRCLYEITEVEPILLQGIDPAVFELELEAVDRRCDGLAILSSVFEGERDSNRPPYPDFFPPLPIDITSTSGYFFAPTASGILGKLDSDSFDPLRPLQEVLMKSSNISTFSMALAPLCLPLGLPNGYIHARVLMEHFRLAAQENSVLPCFDNDIAPVFNRIHSSGDKAVLAEWCSDFFSEDDQERFKCLDLALNYAIKYSSETEQKRGRYLNNKTTTTEAFVFLEQEEVKALEMVQRLSDAKSALSDKICISKALLDSATGDPRVSRIALELMKKLKQSLWNSRQKNSRPPDKLLEVLLSEASLLASNYCMDEVPLSMKQFQLFSLLCNEACQSLSDNHSHIHLGQTIQVLVRSWLFHGDGMTEEQEEHLKRNTGPFVSTRPSNVSSLDEFKEEDTMNFVLDLSNIRIQDSVEDNPYSDEIGHEKGKIAPEKYVTSDEEPSALKKSSRELSEDMAREVALRVAFIMACDDSGTQGHRTKDKGDEDPILLANTGKSKASGLLARIENSSNKQNTYALDCARNLLRIVFAKSELQCQSRIVSDPDQNKSQTVTFSMRHRALRAASILVPQESLEKVIRDEGYLLRYGVESKCSLKRCTFGAFVAKECEQIGLPLSHSDLGEISSIHFSSYARTLWRHFRDDGKEKSSKGRQLLLLLEMTLKDKGEMDAAFVEVLLKEMKRYNLPRTLLLACEAIMSLKQSIGTKKFSDLFSACSDTVTNTIFASANAILFELHAIVRSDSLVESCAMEAISTLQRILRVARAFSDTCEGQERLRRFICALIDVFAFEPCDGRFARKAAEESLALMRRVVDKNEQLKLEERISSLPMAKNLSKGTDSPVGRQYGDPLTQINEEAAFQSNEILK